MSTRGFVGVKENGEIKGWYNHSDSYYDCLGVEMVLKYFKGKSEPIIIDPIESISREDKNDKFIYDGLYCEYAYVYNKDDDVLEIYRGFFETPQWTNEGYVAMDGKGKTYYTHLVLIVDRKIHSKTQALEALKFYNECEEAEEIKIHSIYPERQKCPIVLRKEYSPELKKIIKLCMLEGLD